MFFIGEVIDTKMAYKPNQKDSNGNILPLGSILVKLGGSGVIGQNTRNKYALPAIYNRRIPLIGEQVLLFSAPRVAMAEDSNVSNGLFYFTPYAATNNVTEASFNRIFGYKGGKAKSGPKILADKKELGYTFKKKVTISKPLQPFEGDDLWEGRHGQSIRFSRHYDTENSPGKGIYEQQATWKGSKNHDPLIIINVKKPKSGKGYDIEDLSKDESSIYLTSKHKLSNFKPGFDKNMDVKKIANWDSGPQILASSDRIVLNAKKEKLFLIGKDEAILTGKNVLMQSKKYKVDLDDLMDYINDVVEQLFQLVTAQKFFTTPTGPTGPATNLGDVTKIHKADFNTKFKMP